jgi:hypothetical protein
MLSQEALAEQAGRFALGHKWSGNP